MNWKVIRGHIWNNDEEYEKGISYLENPLNIQFVSEKAKRTFQKRMKYYKVIHEQSWPVPKKILAIEDNNIPFYVQTTLYTGALPVIYKVVRPSEKHYVLSKFINNVDTHALNSKSLYDKVLRANLLGISRDYIELWIKGNNNINILQNTAKKPIVESFRPNFPYEYMQMDFIDMLKYSRENAGYSYILVLIDIFSKYIYLTPCKDKSAQYTRSILKKLFLSGDIPSKLGSDNEQVFKSSEIKSLCDYFGILHIFGKPHSPQTQGFVENKNKQVKNSIVLYMNKYNTRKYYDILDSIAFAINNTKHSVTKISPMEIHKGRHLNVQGFFNSLQTVESSDINENELTKSIVQKQKQLYDQRNEYIRQKLYNVANKRENQNKDNDIFKPGTYVQIATYQTVDSNIQPIQIKLTLFDTILYPQNPLYYIQKETSSISYVKDLKIYPKSLFNKITLKKEKWTFKKSLHGVFKHSFFIVGNVVLNQNTKKHTYKLYYIDPNQNDYKYSVHRLINYDNGEYSDVFYRESLQVVKHEYIPEILKKPERPDFNFVDLLEIPSKKKTQKQFVPTNENVLKFFSFMENESNENYQKRITTKLNLLNNDNIKSLKDIENEHRVSIKYYFEDNEGNLIHELGYILSFKLNRGLMKNRYTNKLEQGDPFMVYFPYDKQKKKWDLELDPNKYNKKMLDGWIFVKVPNFM